MKPLLQDKEVACHHCGDSCDDTISDGVHLFCCYGCRAVHELISKADLEVHYSKILEKNPSVSQIKAERKYAFLENADIVEQLLSFKEEGYSVIRFHLPGIHCSSCIYLLEHLPKINAGILKSEVHFTKHQLTVTYGSEQLSLKEVAVLLSQLGYPPDISLDSLDKTKKHIAKSHLGVKIAVAGFCFGNAMLMTMPEYLDSNFQLSEEFSRLFSHINLALAVPVLFFSAQDYFVKAWKGLRVKNINIDVPIALGLLTLSARSVYEILTFSGFGYIDSLTGLVFFLLIGKWYQSKTYQALSFERDYASYFPVSVRCKVDDSEISRPLRELKKGDVVIIHNDELLPADGKILEGLARIDYSFVTGESKWIQKKIGAKVYAGGRQKGGELVVQLEKSVNSSELTQLWNSDAFRKDQPKLQNWVDKISKYFTLSIIMIAFLTGIYWTYVDPSLVWNSVTAVLIVACPCALALVLPFAYGHSMRILSKYGLYLKNAEVVEALSRIGAIIFDKTGTLTEPTLDVKFVGQPLSEEECRILKSGVANSAHPLSKIIHSGLPKSKKYPISGFNEFLGKGFSAEINGVRLKVGSASFVGVASNSVAKEAHVHVFINGYKGYYKIHSKYRERIFDLLDQLKEHYKTYLLSGDSDHEKAHLSPHFQELRFNQKPNDKLTFIDSLPDADHLMIGDGLNDAGALKKASVGIAVTEDIYQFSPACDAIMSATQITRLNAVLKFTKSIIKVIFLAFLVSFSYNLIGLSFAVSGNLTPLFSAVLMPVSSVTVVALVTLSVSLLANKYFK